MKQAILTAVLGLLLTTAGFSPGQQFRCQITSCQEPIEATEVGTTELLAEVAACELASTGCYAIGGQPGPSCYVISTVPYGSGYRSTVKKCCYKCGLP